MSRDHQYVFSENRNQLSGLSDSTGENSVENFYEDHPIYGDMPIYAALPLALGFWVAGSALTVWVGSKVLGHEN